MKRFLAAIVLVCLFMAPACQRQTKLILPPNPPPPAPAPPAPPPIETPPPDLQPVPSAAPDVVVATPPPPGPAPSRRAAPPPTPEPAAPQQPPPTLAPLLTTAEQQRLSAEIASDLNLSRGNIASIVSSPLSAQQRSDLERIRTFLAQAEALEASDPFVAAGLARRAAVLSDELLRAVRR